jgi:uncharacterized protein with NRDE domain
MRYFQVGTCWLEALGWESIRRLGVWCFCESGFVFSVLLVTEAWHSARTNITEPHAVYEMSRGYVVSSLLSPDHKVPHVEDINTLINSDKRFAGFNLLLFSPASSGTLSYDATLITNGGGGNPISARSITPEERVCGALSNGIDHKDGNEWPKVKDGISGLSRIMEEDVQEEDAFVERLFHLMW